MEFQELLSIPGRIRENVMKVIVGKQDAIDLVMTALFAGGHVLLEDVPGTGKTVLAESLAASVSLAFKRIQFTPDLMPSDVTGMNVYNQKEEAFRFQPGPVFANVVLADEINRATPRSQASLLECMEEKQVTVDGVTRPLAAPFFVIATQNPIETQGTFPLPEAQLDRFLLKLKMGYPNQQDSLTILDRFILDQPLAHIAPVATGEDILAVQEAVRRVEVSAPVREYMVGLVEKTRTLDEVLLGASPRGLLALLRACQAYALVMGRAYVLPDDVQRLVKPVLGHRVLTKNAFGRSNQAETVLDEVIRQVRVPTETVT